MATIMFVTGVNIRKAENGFIVGVDMTNEKEDRFDHDSFVFENKKDAISKVDDLIEKMIKRK